MAAKKKTVTSKKQRTAAAQEPQKDASKTTTQPIVAQVVEVVVEEAPQPSAPTTDEARKPEGTSASDLPTSEERKLPEASDTDVRKESPAPARERSPRDEPPDETQDKPTDAAEDKSFDKAHDKQKEMVEGLFRKREPEVMPEISTYSGGGSQKSLFFWIIIIIAIAILTSVGLISVTRGIGSLPFVSATPTPTPLPTPTPTPTRVTVSREDVSIQVLNGGGVAGAATKMKEFLESKGYTVESTGNTDEYTYEQTEILVKPGNESTLSLLEEDLRGSYTLGTTAATLSDDVSYDARVIVGKE